MRLVIASKRTHRLRSRLSLLGIMLSSLWLLFLGLLSPVVHAAGPVYYSISPAASSVRPNSTVNIVLTMRTDISIAGASVHLAFNNGSYEAMESAGNSAISFVDYHTEQNDLVFICTNNNCGPGTYQLATITVKAGASGNVTVGFVPKETADPTLNLVTADGTTGNYDIQAGAPASPRKPSKSTYTVPKDDGNGGILPLQIDNDQYQQQYRDAQQTYNNYQTPTVETEKKSFWSTRNIIIVGLAFGFALILALILLIRFARRGGGGGPKTPFDSSGGGPIYYR